MQQGLVSLNELSTLGRLRSCAFRMEEDSLTLYVYLSCHTLHIVLDSYIDFFSISDVSYNDYTRE